MIAVKLPKNTAMACAQSGRDGKDNAWLVVAVICKMGLPPPLPLKVMVMIFVAGEGGYMDDFFYLGMQTRQKFDGCYDYYS